MSSLAKRRRAPNPALAWAALGVWALFVWGLGGEELSLEGTSRFLGPLIHWLLPGISDASSEQLQWAIRKTAHMVEYAGLSFLLLRALLTARTPSLGRSAVFALLLAVAFAAADETRQSLSIQRQGSPWDVALDAFGAAVGIGMGCWIRSRLPRLANALGIATPAARQADEPIGDPT